MSILPMLAQIVVKSATLVGIVGAVITVQWSFLQEHLLGIGVMTYGLNSQDPQCRERRHHSSWECQ